MSKTLVIDVVRVGDRLGDFVATNIGGVVCWIDLKNGTQYKADEVGIQFTPSKDLNAYYRQPQFNKQSKPRFVNMVRYVRPMNFRGEIDNMRGITLFIQLDYQRREVSFSMSICNGDNFCKDVGTTMAKARFATGMKFKYEMVKGKVSERGVVWDIWETLRDCPDVIDYVKDQFYDAGYY